MSDVKGRVEQKRVRGRNIHETITQLSEKYHSGNGWRVVRVTPTLLNFEVLVERSTEQGDKDETEVAEKETPTKAAETKPASTAKKATTATKKTTAAKKSATTSKGTEDS